MLSFWDRKRIPNIERKEESEQETVKEQKYTIDGPTTKWRGDNLGFPTPNKNVTIQLFI